MTGHSLRAGMAACRGWDGPAVPAPDPATVVAPRRLTAIEAAAADLPAWWRAGLAAALLLALAAIPALLGWAAIALWSARPWAAACG